ncbi:hypothetical protein GCM10007901_23840 [Dyella acidisoli]|uniref:Uncharacterized protein n=1 Tax=Dyella acidisoli TaxID=1867834 RepID=A0ABQ5XSK6_9GAMM|nr:hypothetical protein GCM10007901_23840 [Dyella acidisoli]
MAASEETNAPELVTLAGFANVFVRLLDGDRCIEKYIDEFLGDASSAAAYVEIDGARSIKPRTWALKLI